MTLVLSGGAVLTMDAGSRLLPQADIRVDGTDIAAIVAVGQGRKPDDTVIDCADTLVMPGLVNAHTHLAAGILRGTAEDKPRAYWEGGYSIPGQDRLTLDDFTLATRAACAELLLNGVTCVADRYAHMDKLGEAIEASGIRAILGPTILDARGPADWRTTEMVLERWGCDPARRVSAGLAPHALDTCSDALLRRCAEEAGQRGARLFVHVAQSEFEVSRLRPRGYDGAIACLRANGLVGPHIVAAHCIYLRDDEYAALASAQISIAHCPSSNIKIEGRTLPLARLVGRTAIGLGTDWAVSNNAMDMLAECRIAALVGKLVAQDPAVLPVDAMLRLATIDSARALGLDHFVGSIEAGKRADLVVIDLGRLAMNPRHDLAANLLYSGGVAAVRDVLVDGAVLVRGHRLTWADEAELVRELNACARRMSD